MLRKSFIVLFSLFAALSVIATMTLKDRPGREAAGEQRLAKGDAGAIEYFVRGKGQAVILLASYARGASDFNELAQILNQVGYRTLALQFRGIGNSDLGGFEIDYHDLAADIAAVIRQEGIQQPVLLIGHAYGNRIARTFAADYTEHVAGLVLLAAGGEAPTPAATAKAIGITLFCFWSQNQREQAIRYAFFADENAVPDYWINGWYPLAGIVQGRATANTPTGKWADAGTAPLLILQPTEDRAAPAAHSGKLLVKRLKGRAQYKEIQNAGHAALPEQPQFIARQIIQFFSTLH